METELHAIPKGGRSIGGRSPEDTAGEMGDSREPGVGSLPSEPSGHGPKGVLEGCLTSW